MRVRILKPSVGVMDGVSLSTLVPGFAYDLPRVLGNWLVSHGAAAEFPASTIVLIVPLDDDEDLAAAVHMGGVSVDQSTAADKPRRIKRKKR